MRGRKGRDVSESAEEKTVNNGNKIESATYYVCESDFFCHAVSFTEELSRKWDSSSAKMETEKQRRHKKRKTRFHEKKGRADMEILTLVFTICGAATLARGVMAVIDVLDQE